MRIHHLLLVASLALVACDHGEHRNEGEGGYGLAPLPGGGSGGCAPLTTCSADTCGEQPDRCGGTLDCGSCARELLAADLPALGLLEPGPDGHLYWSQPGEDDGGEVLLRMPARGGDVESVARSESFTAIAFTPLHLWSTNWAAKTVERMPLDGGALEVVAEQQGLPHLIAVAGDWIYWVGYVGNAARASLVDGRVETFGATFGDGGGGSVQSLLVTGDRLVVLTSDGGIYEAPLDVSEWTTLQHPIEGEFGFHEGLAADDRHFHWMEGNGGKILRLPRIGGTAEILHDEGRYTTGLALVEGFLYWSTRDGIRRMPADGGEPEEVVRSFVPRHLVADETHLYWAGTEPRPGEEDRYALYRLPLP